MAKLKVLHLITTLPRLSGAADNTRYTVNLLDPDRYEVHLACGPAELDTSRVAPHVRLIVVDPMVRVVAPVSDLRAAWSLHRLFRRERYDIVHTHNSKAGVLGRIAARLARVPIVVHTAHTISFAASTSALVNWFYRVSDAACARLSTRIISVAPQNALAYLSAGIGRPEQYLTIYSGIETDRYLDRSDRGAMRAELQLRDGDVLVTWIGRLNRQKDPVTFVRAAKLIADRLPQVRFIMVGQDSVGESLEPEVRRVIEGLGLGSTVHLLGYRSDIDRLLGATDLVIHTSLYEGLGRSIVETMVAGVPIVATRVDGVPEAVISGERGGLLVPPSDPRAVSQAAVRLIEDPAFATQLALVGQAWARDRFDVRTMVRRIDELYQQLWDNHIRQEGTEQGVGLRMESATRRGEGCTGPQ